MRKTSRWQEKIVCTSCIIPGHNQFIQNVQENLQAQQIKMCFQLQVLKVSWRTASRPKSDSSCLSRVIRYATIDKQHLLHLQPQPRNVQSAGTKDIRKILTLSRNLHARVQSFASSYCALQMIRHWDHMHQQFSNDIHTDSCHDARLLMIYFAYVSTVFEQNLKIFQNPPPHFHFVDQQTDNDYKPKIRP